mmetsp:Transcript_10467/g.14828  ORF Transcript_10467/g.14828 Transcript_10467/m.14828 type:complete len:560 (+) Transcript_10467:223-1902(+)
MSKWLRRGFGHHQQQANAFSSSNGVNDDFEGSNSENHPHPNSRSTTAARNGDNPTSTMSRFPMTTSRSRSTSNNMNMNEPTATVNGTTTATMTATTTTTSAAATSVTTSSRRASPKVSRNNRYHHHHHHPPPFGATTPTTSSREQRPSSQPRGSMSATTPPPSSTPQPPTTTPIQPPPSSSRGNSGTMNSSSAFESHHSNNNNTNNNDTTFLRTSTNPNIRSITNDPLQQQSQSAQSSSSQLRRPAYLLHRDLVIGKGSYGQVCIASRGARDSQQQQRSTATSTATKPKKFACKCVLLRNDPKYIAKLQEEVNVLRELRGHRNVIRLYDVFCVDNELFIITELGRGGDLFHLLTTHPKHGVTESYAAKTVSEMLSAVAFLHSRHICHRDLKLENWVLESGKDVWSPLKLIDFGLSTHYTPGHRLSRVVGSSYYVAPEVLKKSYTEKCDLWSLGVIVYMLLSGAPPFYGKNDDAIKASIVQGEYSFPHELFRDVSNEAMDFVSTLLSYNVEYRSNAHHALSHPWLAANLDREQLERAMDVVGENAHMNNSADHGPMTMIE